MHLFLPLGIALSVCTMLSAQPPGPGGPPPFEMLKDLDLSEAQWQSIHAIFEKHRGAHFAKQQTLESKEKILMTALAEPATTEAQLKDLHAAASDARLAVLLEGRTMMLEIQAVLNPEQQAKAKAQRLKMQQTMDEHRPAMEDPAGMGGPFLP